MNETSGVSCVGIIMDGNRRWAKERGIPKLEGHRAGLEKLKEIARAARALCVKHLVVYAFSTENWNREAEEVSYLMDLFFTMVKREAHELGQEGARIRFSGQRERFSKAMQEAMSDVEKDTVQNSDITLWICLSYGGRAEIVAAAKAAADSGEPISEDAIAKNMWTYGMPDPDIIIRTGGDKRLSGFLTWQSVYSELFFTDSYWPDFTEAELATILGDFATRERRRGK